MTEQAVSTGQTRHHEVPVRVKAMIDERIAPIVAALNDFPDVFTMTSCEGFPPNGPGMVSFRSGETWQEGAAFCLWLQEEFGQRQEQGVSVSMDCDRHYQLHGRLDIEWSAVERVAAELRAMAYKFNAATLDDAIAAATG
jgi:hypothetical protein